MISKQATFTVGRVLVFLVAMFFCIQASRSAEQQNAPSEEAQAQQEQMERERMARRTLVIENVLRVFKDDQHYYTIFFRVGDSSELAQAQFYIANKNSMKFYDDVPRNKTMWVQAFFPDEVEAVRDINFPTYFEVHIRSAQDLVGGSWDHGDGGRGQTNALD